MTNDSVESTPYLESPCEENDWMWTCYGLGMKFQHRQEWQARWKLHWMAVASGSEQDRPRNQALPQ